MIASQFAALVRRLTSLPSETEWVEFKHNWVEPEEIGQNLSALSNSAALLGKSHAYIVWGIDDESHAIIGTTFRPRQCKVGNEELENWLSRLLAPRIDFRIHEEAIDGMAVVVFEVPPAPNRPAAFMRQKYIRVGSYTKKLQDYQEKERALWGVFAQVSFEEGIAKENVSADDVLDLIDYPKYFRLMQRPLPADRKAILESLTSEGIIRFSESDRYSITNVGGILFALSLNDFDRLARKALRVIIYKGNDRVETVKEQTGGRGYAVGFKGAIQFICDQLPQNEQIEQALRKEVRMYPEIAIRELVANALIHQDFGVTGAGPMVEIFEDRMEITNPGIPLIDTLRFIDGPPRSRNETLAALMRRMAICEERGSGIDKVIFNVEVFQLPAPDFRVAGENMVAVLYGPREFAQMDRKERIRACYQHACLQYVSGQRMTNSTLRKRLGIDDAKYTLASKTISDTIDAELVALHSGTRKDASYVPFWA